MGPLTPTRDCAALGIFFACKVSEFKFILMPAAIAKRRDLNPTEKMVLAYGLSFGPGKRCFASNRRIAECCGMTTGTVRNVLSSLRKRGIIVGRDWGSVNLEGPDTHHEFVTPHHEFVNIEKREEERKYKSPPTSEKLIDLACEQLEGTLIDNGFRASIASSVLMKLERMNWEQPDDRGGFDNKAHLFGYAASLAAHMQEGMKK